MATKGIVKGIVSNLVTLEVDGPVSQNEICYISVGGVKLMSEVIKVIGKNAFVQVFESTRGMRVGDEAEFQGHMLEVTLGPGMLSRNYDGLQNDLDKMEGVFLKRGDYTFALDNDKKWDFKPLAKAGDTVSAGDWLGEVDENFQPHKIMVPFKFEGSYTVKSVVPAGQYTINDLPISLYTALGQAGGIDTKTGDTTNIQLIRNGQTYNLNTIQLEKQGLSLHNLLIQPDDTIFVNTKQDQKLYVMGESSKSQAISLRDQGMSLSDVLGESEGINPYSASAARIYVMRTDLKSKQSTIYHLNLSSLGNLALANQFDMKKNDIVYIDATGLTRWQRVMNQIVPFSSALYSFDQLGK